MKYLSNPSNDIGSWLLQIIHEIQKRAMSIVFVLLIFVLLWFVPQINDLILVLNQSCNHWITTPVFFVTLIVFAFFISAAGDYFSPPELWDTKCGVFPNYPKDTIHYFKIPKDAKEVFIDSQKEGIYSSDTKLSESSGQYIRRVFPKLLGSLLILIAAFAINNTFTEVYGESIAYGGNLGFYIFLVIFLILLRKNVSNWFLKQLEKFPRVAKYGPIVFASLCILLIIILGFLNKGGTRGDSVRMFYALVLLTVLFLTLSLSYNEYVLWLKQKIGGKLIVIFIVFILFSYLFLFFKPTALEDITPISIIMICLIGIYTVLNVLKIIGRWLDLPLLGIVAIVAIGLAIYNAGKDDFKHYEASTTDNIKHKPSERLTIEAYSQQWVEDRLHLMRSQNPGEKFPIILVSAEGGGSRAGLWSFLVQSYLFDKNQDYFEKYLFAMTGASGGGVGNNMFYVQASEILTNPEARPLKYSNWSPKYSCDNDTLGFKYRPYSLYT